MVKDKHIPTGELHLVPAVEEDPTARGVDFSLVPVTRKRVRLSISARERLLLRPGSYPAEVAEVLGRTVIIIKGALHANGTR